jgi:hypothetical protein
MAGDEDGGRVPLIPVEQVAQTRRVCTTFAGGGREVRADFVPFLIIEVMDNMAA